jgi:uncharacterized protein
MKFFITGGTGFVGSKLAEFLTFRGHEVTVMARGSRWTPPGVEFVAGDGMVPGKWQESVARQDVIINLAGVTIFKRWNEKYKKLLRDGRVMITRHVVEAIPAERAPEMTLLSASGVGYYGFHKDEELTEESAPGTDFMAGLAKDWESEAYRAADKGARVATTRFGVVLGAGGGALKQMVLPFKLFVGGSIGSGEQWFSWIHIEDLCRAMLFVAENKELKGPFNFASPFPVKNGDLAQAIGKALRRPSFFPAPGFMIELVMGEFGSVILKGQRVIPKRLLDLGFAFKYPDVGAALKEALGS